MERRVWAEEERHRLNKTYLFIILLYFQLLVSVSNNSNKSMFKYKIITPNFRVSH